jgi:hypothetical protein
MGAASSCRLAIPKLFLSSRAKSRDLGRGQGGGLFRPRCLALLGMTEWRCPVVAIRASRASRSSALAGSGAVEHTRSRAKRATLLLLPAGRGGDQRPPDGVVPPPRRSYPVRDSCRYPKGPATRALTRGPAPGSGAVERLPEPRRHSAISLPEVTEGGRIAFWEVSRSEPRERRETDGAKPGARPTFSTPCGA